MSGRLERSGQILAAAYNVFGDKGYYAAKMDDIANEAGVAKGTLYLYFANKEELFHAVIEKILHDYLETYEYILDESIPFVDKLTSLVRHHLFFIRDRYDFARMNVEEGPFNEKLRRKMAAIMERASNQFTRALQEAYPDAFDEEGAYLSYLCFSHMGDGMIGDMFWTKRRFPDEVLEERAQFVANLFVNGLSHMRTDREQVL